MTTIYHQMPGFIPSELDPRILGVLGLSLFDDKNSAARKQMFSSHIGQALVVKGATERTIRNGMENEYGKYTFSVKMPVDADIIRLIERYPTTGMGDGSIAHNPETLVIYENDDTKEVCCLSLQDYFSHHQYFGFRYVRRPAMRTLRTKPSIAKGTILQDSPAVTENGGYKFGVQCNVAFMSHPAVSEDGILISRDVLDKFSFKKYETRVVEFGSKYYPLNTYGDENNYKIFPDIGEVVREDGVLMALRPYDERNAVVEQSRLSTMTIDPSYDRRVYADGAGGRVIDIRVMHDPESAIPTTPVGMELQAEKYNAARLRYYQEIYNVYERLRRERGPALLISHEFHRLVVEAYSVLGPTKKREGESPERVTKMYKNVPLDDWRIEFVIEYDVTPTIGFKLTDTHGGKGVICQVCEPHEMPIDAAGNRADIVMDPNATVSRMNLGRLYEQFINAASRDIAVELRQHLDARIGQMVNPEALRNHANWNHAWSRLMRYYEIVSPEMYQWFVSGQYSKKPEDHMASVLKDGITVYCPSNSAMMGPEMVELINQEFNLVYGPVTYIGNSGIESRTASPVRIGSLYIMLLEKTADDWTAVSSGKWQNFGVLSPITNRDKHAHPTRNQAIRAFGETEIRIVTSYCGPYISAELLDRNNNIATHNSVLKSILYADKPSNIQQAVDRTVHPLGNARPLQLVKHLKLCGGIEFTYNPYVPNMPNALADLDGPDDEGDDTPEDNEGGE